jgi:hypothetical protein
MDSAGFECKEGVRSQKKNWKSEFTGWAVLMLILLIILIGLFGFGPISKKKIGSVEEGFLIEFQSILRYRKETPLKFTVTSSIHSKHVGISVNKEFFKGITTEKIIPEPYETLIGSEDYIFNFSFPNIDDPSTISFYLKPNDFGRKILRVGKEGETPKEMEIFIYP